MRRFLSILLCALVATPVLYALPVIPGAPAAPGMDTRAAYCSGTSPTVLRVTSLSDSGANTLRAALETSGNRVVIFERSGNIVLGSDIVIDDPCITVAGQTAPDPGITLTNGGIQIRTHDVLIQHLRIRPGFTDHCTDGLGNYPGGTAYNVVYDHVSVSWGQDENLYTYVGGGPGGAANIVFWRSITSENLAYAGPASAMCNPSHPDGEPGHGFLVTENSTGVSIIQSLFAHNEQRNPLIQNGSAVVSLNNIIYNWYKEWGFAAESRDNLPSVAWHASVAGNRFIRGPNTVNSGDGNVAWMFSYLSDGTQAGNEIYRHDNTIANNNGLVEEEFNGNEVSGVPYDPNVPNAPSQAPLPVGYTVLSSVTLEDVLLPVIGARPANRDSVDARVVSEVVSRTGSFISSQDDVGGWPSLAVNTRALSTPASPNSDSGNGYTNLEVWLQGYAAALEGAALQPDPEDAPAASGTVFVSALFGAPAGTPLTGYVSDTGGAWSFQTGSTGVLEINSAGLLVNKSVDTDETVTALTVSAGLPLTSQYDLNWDWRVLTLPSGSAYSVWARTTTTAVTGYSVVYSVNAGTLTLWKAVDDTYTPLSTCGSVSLSTSTTYHLIFRVRDASKNLIFDGAQCASTADNEIAAAGRVGISSHASLTADDDTHGIHVDNFVVTDVGRHASFSSLVGVR